MPPCGRMKLIEGDKQQRGFEASRRAMPSARRRPSAAGRQGRGLVANWANRMRARCEQPLPPTLAMLPHESQDKVGELAWPIRGCKELAKRYTFGWVHSKLLYRVVLTSARLELSTPPALFDMHQQARHAQPQSGAWPKACYCSKS